MWSKTFTDSYGWRWTLRRADGWETVQLLATPPEEQRLSLEPFSYGFQLEDLAGLARILDEARAEISQGAFACNPDESAGLAAEAVVEIPTRPANRPSILVVVDTENEGREVLGEWNRTEEDGVAYWREEDGTLAWAPEDCVEIVRGYRPAPGVPAREEYRPLVNLETGREAVAVGSALVEGYVRLEPTEYPGYFTAPDGTIWAGCQDGKWRPDARQVVARNREARAAELAAGRDPRD